MANRANNDQLLAIWALKRLGWSFRRIARLNLPSSHHTITHCYEIACELMDAKKLPIFAMDERAIRLRYCGDTTKIEKIDGVRNSGVCGGGRRISPHIYDSELKEIGDEE